jgi:putative phosphoribosyl transferase
MTRGRNDLKKCTQTEVFIQADGATLEGTLNLPEEAAGIVLFAHGSGSSRHSPRNRYVAQVLQSRGIGTLLFDLMTREEESVDVFTGKLRFDIPFLANRLVEATRWILRQPETRNLAVGYFGASTGAAAALMAAPEFPDTVAAIVSRGGRPDLAHDSLRAVLAPTLLLVGSEDEPVISMNRQALAKLRAPVKMLVIVPGATHLFEEPGKLEEVAQAAADWFAQYLAAPVRTAVAAIASR